MKNNIDRLRKIQKYAHKLIAFTSNISFEDFVDDDEKNYACVFALSQIGELANGLDKEIQNDSRIPWHMIIAVWNRIVHGYSDLKMKIIWDAIKIEIPELINQIDEILDELY